MVQKQHLRPHEQAEVLAQQGRVVEAFHLLQAAIAAGNALAAATLAEWRITGEHIRRDIAAARELFGLAGALGLIDREETHIALLANGAGGSGRCWSDALNRLEQLAGRSAAAQRQIDLITAMPLSADGDPLTLPDAEVLSQIPRIAIRRGFMSTAECRYLIERSLPMLQPSIVIDSRTGQPVRNPVRTADSTGFPFMYEDPATHAINRRIMAATGTSYEQGEPIQVLSYLPGQEYKLHSDCLPPGSNQRAQTFLVALSDDFEGGETSFPRIDLNIRVAAGDAIHFHNVDRQGRPEPLAWHAGLPVRRGRKLLLSKWIRQAPLDLGGPPGMPF